MGDLALLRLNNTAICNNNWCLGTMAEDEWRVATGGRRHRKAGRNGSAIIGT